MDWLTDNTTYWDAFAAKTEGQQDWLGEGGRVAGAGVCVWLLCPRWDIIPLFSLYPLPIFPCCSRQPRVRCNEHSLWSVGKHVPLSSDSTCHFGCWMDLARPPTPLFHHYLNPLSCKNNFLVRSLQSSLSSQPIRGEGWQIGETTNHCQHTCL